MIRSRSDSTVNHDHWKRQHMRHLATEAAPSRPLWLRPRRRRQATSLLAALGIIAVIAACSVLMLVLPVIAVP